MDQIPRDDSPGGDQAGTRAHVNPGHADCRRARRIGERMHGVLRHGLAAETGGILDATHRLRGIRARA